MGHKTESNKRTRQNLTGTDDSAAVTRGKAGREEVDKGKRAQICGDRGEVTSDGEHAVQYTHDVSQNRALDICMM